MQASIVILAASGRLLEPSIKKANILAAKGWKVTLISENEASGSDVCPATEVDLVKLNMTVSSKMPEGLDVVKLNEKLEKYPKLSWDSVCPALTNILTQVIEYRADVYIAQSLPMLIAATMAADYYAASVVFDACDNRLESLHLGSDNDAKVAKWFLPAVDSSLFSSKQSAALHVSSCPVIVNLDTEYSSAISQVLESKTPKSKILRSLNFALNGHVTEDHQIVRDNLQTIFNEMKIKTDSENGQRVESKEKKVVSTSNGIKRKPAEKPLISVVVPTFNRAEYITESISSLLSQNYSNLEIIIVDDGSTDNTSEVVSKIKDSRIQYHRRPHSKAPATRNFGLNQAKGEWILNNDSDDIILPGTIEKYLKAIQEYPEAEVFYGDIVTTNSKLQPIGDVKFEDWYQRNADFIAMLIVKSCIPNPGTMILREAFNKIGFYDTNFPRAHDYEWWSRAAGSLVFKHVGEYTSVWRWHDTNLSETRSAAGLKKVDTSFEVRVVKNMLERYSLKELYPNAGWESELPKAEAFCHLQIMKRLSELGDTTGALEHGNRSLSLFPSNEAATALQKIQSLEETVSRRPVSL